MSKSLVCLYQEHVSNLKVTMDKSRAHGYDCIVTPIVNPKYYREFDDPNIKMKHLAFSRSDLILESNEWLHHVISKINDNIDCDSDNEMIRKHSEKTLAQEISFADHLVQHGHILFKLNGNRTVNLARIISKSMKGTALMEVPMVDPKLLSMNWHLDNGGHNADANGQTQCTVEKSSDTWQWWNKFRSYADFNAKIKVALELSADIPSEEEIARWLGEPVECLIISAHLFIRNSHNYPVLSKGHQDVIRAFLLNNIHFMVKCNLNDGSLRLYSEYLKHIAKNTIENDPMHGFDDLLEIPLQPLYDNLDSYTYEVFEKDPIKYLYYQRAIELALVDLIDEQDKSSKTAIVMVVGAGRGPLVRATINASVNTNRKIKVYIIEKNPNAIITLTSLVDEMWADQDIHIISCDMRDFQPPEKVDMLVSELLGSFGDNELSPECLDGAQKHLKPNGISIPNKSTSYINPVMSSKIFNLVRLAERQLNPREKPNSYASQAESNYVVYIKNAYHIDRPKSLFEFYHPNKSKVIDNNRYKTLTFAVKMDCVLHGFAGYFDTVLYKDIILSIHPETHSKGLSSWFSMFFPITEPQQLKSGDVIEVNFWRCVSPHKVWYEWNTISPHITHIHNHNGRSFPIYK